ncbi:hypothetical protein M118_4797 [Bacteroides fragilis str. 3783N1-2]|nr:hypothetical protein M118_4797 [Bacteroides fragilis str. 3783N1-2]
MEDFATCIVYIAAYTADSFADRNRQGFALFLRRSGDNNQAATTSTVHIVVVTV